VLGMALALPLLAAVALSTAGAATASLDTQPHVNVFMALDATDADVKRVEQALRAQPAVAAVRFVSRTQALEELKATTHLADMLAALDDNPLPHAFTVRLAGGASAESVAGLRAQWARLPKVDSVSADLEWAERLGYIHCGHFGGGLVLDGAKDERDDTFGDGCIAVGNEVQPTIG